MLDVATIVEPVAGAELSVATTRFPARRSLLTALINCVAVVWLPRCVFSRMLICVPLTVIAGPAPAPRSALPKFNVMPLPAIPRASAVYVTETAPLVL